MAKDRIDKRVFAAKVIGYDVGIERTDRRADLAGRDSINPSAGKHHFGGLNQSRLCRFAPRIQACAFSNFQLNPLRPITMSEIN
jgi:hypothetical protein